MCPSSAFRKPGSLEGLLKLRQGGDLHDPVLELNEVGRLGGVIVVNLGGGGRSGRNLFLLCGLFLSDPVVLGSAGLGSSCALASGTFAGGLGSGLGGRLTGTGTLLQGANVQANGIDGDP